MTDGSLLRLLRGRPDPEQLAALVAVLWARDTEVPEPLGHAARPGQKAAHWRHAFADPRAWRR